MIVITDLLKLPFDEGAKNTAYNIVNSLMSGGLCKIISVNGDEGVSVDVEVCAVNKAFIDIFFITKLRAQSNSVILYVPESSATFFSIIRAKLLKVYSGKEVFVLALQPRKYYCFEQLMIKLIAPKMIMTPSLAYAKYLKEVGMNSIAIPLGVNDSIYKQYDVNERLNVRRKFKVDVNKIVLLHVGHIRKSRNLDVLIEVKKRRPDIEVVIVGSTYNESDYKLRAVLLDHDVIVINQYIENMAEIYNLADYYVFPVLDDQAAIATPLSVLEAMSCNLRILTTRFGSLVDMFSPDKDFRFIEDSTDVLKALKKDYNLKSECANRQKVGSYTWENIARRIEMIVRS